MTVQDFTTYTESDTAGELSVAASKIDLTQMLVGSVGYVAKDYGADYFPGDFIVRFRWHVTTATDDSFNSASNLIWAFTNLANHTWVDIPAGGEGMLLRTAYSGSYFMQLRDTESATSDTAVLTDSWPEDWWVEVERSGTTLTAKVYSDAFSTLIDTMSVTCSTNAKRWHTAIGGAEQSGGDPDYTTGYIEDFEIIFNEKFEDLTTYTETDPNAELTVIAPKVTLVNFQVKPVAHLDKDYGVDYFGDFVIRFKFNWNAATKVGGQGGEIIVCTLTVDDVHTFIDIYDSVGADFHDAIMLRATKDHNTSFRLQLWSMNASPLELGIQNHVFTSLPQDIWIELSRVGSTATVTAKLYSDAFSTLFETLTTAAATQDFSCRYLTAVGSKGESGDAVPPEADYTDGYIENIEIVSNVPLSAPGGYIKDPGESISLNVIE